MSAHHVAAHRRPTRRRRVVKVALVALAGALLVALVASVLAYRQLDGNITELDTTEVLGTDRPDIYTPPVQPAGRDKDTKPLNILLLGSDTRAGKGNDVGGETPGLSDTTILMHLSADRKRAYSVSLPRDAMVERPSCMRKDREGTDPGGLSMFNEAYAVGGPGCTQRTVEQLTGIRLDHFVVVDFAGFRQMVDALGGVPVCLPSEVNDEVGRIYLPAGSYEATGQQALDYVRVRYEISDNGDIGRMRRQQVFLAAMVNKAVSAGTLTNPVRLYNFLDAATKSLTTDPGLASLSKLTGLAREVQGIGLENVVFLTVPFETYEPDPNRLVWAPEAQGLWKRLLKDEPLSSAQLAAATTAADGKPSRRLDKAGSGGSRTPGTSAGAPNIRSDEIDADEAQANGLCA
jgi:LCP family protein required for cell wall assembly